VIAIQEAEVSSAAPGEASSAGWVGIQQPIGGMTELTHECRPDVLSPWCRLFKRIVDIVVALVTLVVTLPVLVLAALALVAESPGGAFFVQTRVGLAGRPFRIVKLRTMRVGNDDKEHRAYVAALIRGEGEPQDGMYKIVDDDRRTEARSTVDCEAKELRESTIHHEQELRIQAEQTVAHFVASAREEIEEAVKQVLGGFQGLQQVEQRSLSLTDAVPPGSGEAVEIPPTSASGESNIQDEDAAAS
jgi:hypothetical protein